MRIRAHFLALLGFFCWHQVHGAIFTVTSAGDSGPNTLRAAITSANAISPTASTIKFNLPSPFTIFPLTPLPNIHPNITIDGTTQPNFMGTPIVVVDGASTSGNAFNLTGGNDTIKSLVVNNWTGNGINVTSSNNVISGCFIGTDPTGSVAAPNGANGIFIDASHNTVTNNVISGNVSAGIFIHADRRGFFVTQITIQQNLIGVNVAGNSPVPNATGIHMLGQSGAEVRNVLVGGPGLGNVISGNTGIGVHVDVLAAAAVIQGNHIGTDKTNTLNLANGASGINLSQDVLPATEGTLIGGTAPGQANAILFNGNAGVLMNGNTFLNTVLENSIFGNVGGAIVLLNGANCEQQAPTFNSALECTSANSLIVSFTVPPAPSPCHVATNPNFRVELFNTPVNVPEGLTFLKADTPVSSGSTQSVTVPGSFTGFVSGTATNLNAGGVNPGNTSPFGAPVPIESETMSVTITQMPPGTICAGSSKDLVATVSGAIGTNFKFVWSDGFTQNNVPSPATHAVSPQTNTQFFVTASDLTTSCIAQSAPITVNVDNPSATLTASPNLVCRNEQVHLSLTILGGTSQFDVEWSDGFKQTSTSSKMQRVVTPLTTTTYFATITDSSGCIGTSNSVKVTVSHISPVTLVTNKTTIIAGQAAVLTVLFSDTQTLFWSDGTIDKNATSPFERTVKPQKTTTYTVTAQNADGCQSTSNPVTIKVKPAIVVNLDPIKKCFCPGECAIISGSIKRGKPPFTLSWSDNKTFKIHSRTIKRQFCKTKSASLAVTVTDSAHHSATSNKIKVKRCKI